MKSKDIRVLKTKKNIEDTFLQLIKEKSFVDITIKDICDEAMISRSTFYAHYKDKYDLLEYFFEKITSNFIAIGVTYFSDKSHTLKIEAASNILHYIHENADIFKTFLELNEQNLDLFNHLNNIIYKSCLNYLSRTNKVDKYGLGNAYVAQIYTSIIMTSIRWVAVNKNPEDFNGILQLSSDINEYFLL